MTLFSSCFSSSSGEDSPSRDVSHKVITTGAYQRVDSRDPEITGLYKWLKAELTKENIHLSGTFPLEVQMQVVAGYNYQMYCEYREKWYRKREILLVWVYVRADGVKEILQIQKNPD